MPAKTSNIVADKWYQGLADSALVAVEWTVPWPLVAAPPGPPAAIEQLVAVEHFVARFAAGLPAVAPPAAELLDGQPIAAQQPAVKPLVRSASERQAVAQLQPRWQLAWRPS